MRHYWLLKSEPTRFSIDDLAARSQQQEPWDGVRNYQARNFLRAMRPGDLAFFYHSSCLNPGIVGFVKIMSLAYPDKSAFDLSSTNYDPKSKVDKPRWFCVDVQLVSQYKTIISLKSLKNQPYLAAMLLLQRGNRLSVMPVTQKEWKVIMNLSSVEKCIKIK